MDVSAQSDDIGIGLNGTCLLNGSCTFSPYKALNIRTEVQEDGNKVKNIVQDIFLGASFFIGTVCTIALVWSGFLMMMAGADEGQFSKGVQGIKYSLIGLALVALSYLIIRAIQFIAQGNQ